MGRALYHAGTLSKRCSTCKTHKPVDDFYPKEKGSLHLVSQCKTCRKRLFAEYSNRQDVKENLSRKTKEYYNRRKACRTQAENDKGKDKAKARSAQNVKMLTDTYIKGFLRQAGKPTDQDNIDECRARIFMKRLEKAANNKDGK